MPFLTAEQICKVNSINMIDFVHRRQFLVHLGNALSINPRKYTRLAFEELVKM